MLFTVIGFTVNAQYTQIPDANFEAALEDLGYDDISGDGQVLTANIATVTSLNVSNKSISDLTGIEAFTALETLNCGSNSISSLDVSGNSQLVELTCFLNDMISINVSNCTQLSKLDCKFNDFTSIDLSTNTQLKELSINSNELNSIDVSNNTLLEDLNVGFNNLTSLNISNNILLTKLFITNNDISTLDLNNNINIVNLRVTSNNLTELDLRNLTIENFENLVARSNNLTCISVNNPNYATQNFPSDDYEFSKLCGTYTYIADPNFEAYLDSLGLDDVTGDYSIPTANITGITTLTIPDNSNISDLTGIGAFTALESLTVNNNNLTNLDVSKNTALKTLSCANNSITALDFSTNTLLEDIICSNNEIASIDITNNSVLTFLNVSENPLRKLDVANNIALEILSAVTTDIIQLNLSNNTALEELEIASDLLVNLNLKNGNNANITQIDLRNNPNLTCALVDDINETTGWTNVDNQLTFNDVECVITNYTLIPDSNFEARLFSLGLDDIASDGQVPTSFIQNITELDVSNTFISDLTGVDGFSSLEILRLPGVNNINLSGNTTIKELYANGSSGTIDVSNMTALEYLDCSEGFISGLITTNATALKEIQTYFSFFSSLDLSTNSALEKLVCYQSALADLNITGLTNLKELIVYNTELQSLDLSTNTALEKVECYGLSSSSFTINTNGATALQELYAYRITGLTDLDVSSNTNLTLLHLYNNNNQSSLNITGLTTLSDLDVTDAALTSLDLSTNTGLTSLNVSLNDLVSLDLRNGNNANLVNFDATGNDDLGCVMVDDVSTAETNFTNIDDGVIFSTDTCGYTLIPDSNFENALVAYDDIASDGKVPTANIETITSLNLSYPRSIDEEIDDITGIEAFIALETLGLAAHSINEADFTSNINLISVDITSNGLTSLDITGLTKLEELLCYAGSLSELNVSTNSSLKILDVDSNTIDSLDVSMLANLTSLNCSSNTLTYLNIKNGNNSNFTSFNATGNINLTCIEVDNVAYAEANFTNIENTASFSEKCGAILVAPQVILEGAFSLDTGNIVMHDNLRDNTSVLIPTTSPYTDAATCEATVFDTTGENAVVDWVEVQLRNAGDITQIESSKSALLLRNGNVVDTDGTSPVPFSQEQGDFYLGIAHRNHLTITSSTTHTLSGTTTTIDLTNTSNVNGGSSALINLGDGYNGMPLGDVDGNGQVQNSDSNSSITQIGISGYSVYDVNLDGQIQNSDVNTILQNIGKGEQ